MKIPDILAHGGGYLTLTPIVCMIPPLGGYNLALILTLTIAVRNWFILHAMPN